VAPCAYPRFSAKGALRVAAREAPSARSAPRAAPVHAHAPSTYDGWIISYDYLGSLKNQGQTLTLSDDVLVPQEPKKTSGDQDVAFFNGFETNAGADGDILQPVLDFGAYGVPVGSSAGVAAVPSANGGNEASGSCSCRAVARTPNHALTPWALLLGLGGGLCMRRRRGFGHVATRSA
jgi:hypothetical protein